MLPLSVLCSSISYTPASIPFTLCKDRTTTLLGDCVRVLHDCRSNRIKELNLI